MMNDLYKNEWRLYHNFFIPSVKRHDKPKTPYQRILESKHIKKETKQRLKALLETLNPFKLKRTIDEKIARIHQLAR